MSPNPRTANEVRRAFLDFFVRHGHTEVASASLIPHDPTVMFTVAGMVPFKSYFTGDEAAPYKRATTSQKCARAGGKHNDLDDVGRTARHLVFFEMLGNFSFGDYFKTDAIAFAWDFVTNTLGYDPEKLWVTVHESDDEAEATWLDVSGLPKARIQRLGDKDNFWQMGETGPCGPCSEIFVDKGEKWGADGGPLHGAEERFMEVWNLVFMQFDQRADGSRERLPRPSIDTGAGLERNLCILQGVDSVWDTDLMQPLVQMASSLTGHGYSSIYDDSADGRDDLSLRILAEHARSGTMLVADGVFPSNEGRGYVLRRILRRAIRHAYRLGTEKLVLPAMVDTAIAVMGDAYPVLRERRDFIAGVIAREEERFRQTLKSGSTILDNALDELPASGRLSGAVAFQLHDTFGFPRELTTEITAERGVEVDQDEFDTAMAEQQRRARSARKDATTPEAIAEQYRAVAASYGVTEFVGYTDATSSALVRAVIASELRRGHDGAQEVEVFLDRTPFYAESGGQVGDTGVITGTTGQVEVDDTTYALPGLIRHHGWLTGELDEGDHVTADIDVDTRNATRKNHTGTHLLHWALRTVLGDHVKQAGSLVGPERLRFDFSHYDALTPAQIREIEDRANAIVLSAVPAENGELTKTEAEQRGAIAFFGDKYGDKVRILQAGPSLEFCGGTHVSNVGQIGAIKIVSEGSIGSNLRRIEATTGLQTLARLRDQEAVVGAAAAALKVKSDEVPARVEALLAERRDLERQLDQLRKQAAGGAARDLAAAAEGGVVVARVDGPSRDGLRDLAVAVREQLGIRAVVLLGAPAEGGVAIVGAVTKDSGLNASALIAEAAKAVGGGGGKAADLAMAGGRQPENLDRAVALARKAVGL